MADFLRREWKFLTTLLLLTTALAVAYSEYRQYREESRKQPPPAVSVNIAGEPSKPGEPQVVYVQGQATHTREVVYVPKEIDPKTGAPEKTDVQFERRASKIYVKVNGKEFEVPSEVKEETKFEQGKLVVTERTEMHINLTAPPAVLQPRAGVVAQWGGRPDQRATV